MVTQNTTSTCNVSIVRYCHVPRQYSSEHIMSIMFSPYNIEYCQQRVSIRRDEILNNNASASSGRFYDRPDITNNVPRVGLTGF